MSYATDKKICYEILDERERQEEKWDEQNHPSLDQVLLNRKGGCTPRRMCEHYEIPEEGRAKAMCEIAHERKETTFAVIVIEELSEAISCLDDEAKMRAELIQCAAVIVNWIGAIDRRSQKRLAEHLRGGG